MRIHFTRVFAALRVMASVLVSAIACVAVIVSSSCEYVRSSFNNNASYFSSIPGRLPTIMAMA